MKPYTAAVVGLGNIGLLYDYHLSQPEYVLTHSCAFHHHSGYEMIGAVDTDQEKRKLFETKYHKPSFATFSDMLRSCQPDVIAFCAPYQAQPKIVSDMIQSYCPKAILLEKPLAQNYQEAQSLGKLLDEKRVISCVNYIRRFEPGMLKMLDMIQAGKIGHIQKIVVWYSKSLKTNGCHAVDIILYLMNRMHGNCHVEMTKNSVKDNEHVMLFNEIPVHFFMTPPQYIRFEIEIIGEKGVFNYQHNGRKITHRKMIQDEVFNNITMLDAGQDIANELNRYQWHVQHALYTALTEQTQISSTIQTALTTEEIVEQMLNEGT